MSVLDILDTIMFKPLILVFEIIYGIVNKILFNQGLSILVLSIAVNILTLPLYKRADLMQKEQMLTEEGLKKGVSHIKKTFRGDERMMMLSTYYRQNNYKPVHALKGALPLLLQIPFFVAAYRFLSGALVEESFFIIPDFTKPDGLLNIGGIKINLLPILMIAINLISSSVYTKGKDMKAKIQLYIMAAFFLVFLYRSPSGLVFYWTLNNFFSLLKNILDLKVKNPLKAVSIVSSVLGIFLLVMELMSFGKNRWWKDAFYIGGFFLLQMPYAFFLFKKKRRLKKAKAKDYTGEEKVFWCGAAFLSLLVGFLIPSAVIGDSPQEFVNINLYLHPVWFLVSSFCYALGVFVVWLGIYYKLSSTAAKVYFEKIVWVVSGIFLADYLIFSKSFGNINNDLTFERDILFTNREFLLNAAAIILVIFMFLFVYNRLRNKVFNILVIGVLAVFCMSAFNTAGIVKSVNKVKNQADVEGQEEDKAVLNFSSTGKNVVVIMLDRAMGAYIPYIFKEKPELEEKFSGFTYYSNAISFGGATVIGSPALYGGYEYTPDEINKRSSETMVSKQNEALKVMPVIFSENGYEVTVCDPTLANYDEIPDLSIYDEYPNIHAYNTRGSCNTVSAPSWIEHNMRNFFCYGILRASPMFLQKIIYGRGNYWGGGEGLQTVDGIFIAEGIGRVNMDSYSVLTSLPKMSRVTDENISTFMMMSNETTHANALFQEPDYVPAEHIDNTEYEDEYAERFSIDGRSLAVENSMQITHYHTNMAALLRLGDWFDYLKNEGVYDNTRIILVADHGFNLGQLDELILEDGTDCQRFFPLLMVKDFNSKGFNTSDEFMTNGDVPALATEGIIENPVNPFTGKAIDSSEKYAHDQHIFVEYGADGNSFIPQKVYSIHDNIWDKSNWELASPDGE